MVDHVSKAIEEIPAPSLATDYKLPLPTRQDIMNRVEKAHKNLSDDNEMVKKLDKQEITNVNEFEKKFSLNQYLRSLQSVKLSFHSFIVNLTEMIQWTRKNEIMKLASWKLFYGENWLDKWSTYTLKNSVLKRET